LAPADFVAFAIETSDAVDGLKVPHVCPCTYRRPNKGIGALRAKSDPTEALRSGKFTGARRIMTIAIASFLGWLVLLTPLLMNLR